MCAARVAAICGSTNLGVPRLTRRANVVSRRRGNKGNTCGFAGAGVCNRLSFAALFGRVLSYAIVWEGVFRPRVRSPHPTRAWPLFTPRDVSPAGSWLISTGDQPQAQSKFAVETSPPTGEPSLRWRSSPARESERDRRASCCDSKALCSQIRNRCASLLQIDRCTTTLHKASINRKRRTAAQYVYSTKAK